MYTSMSEFFKDLYTNPYYRDTVAGRLKAVDKIREVREKPITIKSLQGHSLIEALSTLVRAWPAEDVRGTFSYKEKADFHETDDLFISDVGKGIDVREVRRSLAEGSVTFNILIQNNLDEFEEYNEVVSDHNFDWFAGGCIQVDFDPVTGDEAPIKDTYVSYASPSSLHHVDLTPNMSSGKLTDAAPTVKRTLYGTIEYHVGTENDLDITLGYVVRSKEGYLLYYNEITGTDLSKMVRRSVQEIWGNHLLEGYEGEVYMGISYLFKGHKIPVCRDRGNVLPSWCKDKRAKKATAYGSYGRHWKPLIPLTRLVIPSLLIIYGLIIVPLRIASGGDGYLGYGHDSHLLTGVIINLIAIVSFLNIANRIEFKYKTCQLIDMIK